MWWWWWRRHCRPANVSSELSTGREARRGAGAVAHMGEARFLRAMAPGRDVACIGATGLGKSRCMYIPAAVGYNTAVSEDWDVKLGLATSCS